MIQKIGWRLAVAWAVATSVSAQAVVIDFDYFVDTTNINGLDLGGVVLTAPAGKVEIYSNGRDGSSNHSLPNSIGSLIEGTWIPDNPLTGVFSSPQNFVKLWGGDGGVDTDSWTLKAFDAVSGGNLLGAVSSGEWSGTPYRDLSISAPGIRRFEAWFTGPSAYGICYDDLEFVPEPTTMSLLALGGLALIRRNRR